MSIYDKYDYQTMPGTCQKCILLHLSMEQIKLPKVRKSLYVIICYTKFRMHLQIFISSQANNFSDNLITDSNIIPSIPFQNNIDIQSEMLCSKPQNLYTNRIYVETFFHLNFHNVFKHLGKLLRGRYLSASQLSQNRRS